ncbi:hypothetical protein [Halorubrum distributum]|uniref:hypothetical protein n=1 Tax=Halorubrum distributum TaxID=29283 RepID=UPI0006780CD3|nr:hypothetical protein [Halorubrum arcis]
MVIRDLIDEELQEKLREQKKRLDEERRLAEEQIDIEYPWNYEPDDYQLDEEGFKPAITWAVESRTKLEESNEDDLQKLAARMEVAEKAFVDEFDDRDVDGEYYKSLFLTISVQDGLISWLCKQDPNLSPSDPNDIGEEVYWGGQKEKAIKTWYDKYAPMELKEGDGEQIKEHWEKFFKHRHRIMHGHPDAYFDDNLALTSLFFLGLIGYTVGSRYDDLIRGGSL